MRSVFFAVELSPNLHACTDLRTVFFSKVTPDSCRSCMRPGGLPSTTSQPVCQSSLKQGMSHESCVISTDCTMFPWSERRIQGQLSSCPKSERRWSVGIPNKPPEPQHCHCHMQIVSKFENNADDLELRFLTSYSALS